MRTVLQRAALPACFRLLACPSALLLTAFAYVFVAGLLAARAAGWWNGRLSRPAGQITGKLRLLAFAGTVEKLVWDNAATPAPVSIPVAACGWAAPLHLLHIKLEATGCLPQPKLQR